MLYEYWAFTILGIHHAILNLFVGGGKIEMAVRFLRKQ